VYDLPSIHAVPINTVLSLDDQLIALHQILKESEVGIAVSG